MIANSFINPFETNYNCKICDGPMTVVSSDIIFKCDICSKYQMRFVKFHHESSYNLDWEKITIDNFSYIWFAKVLQLRLRKQMNPRHLGGYLILETSSEKHFSSELIKTKLLPRLEMLNLFQ
jgi:hypothetical protein